MLCHRIFSALLDDVHLVRLTAVLERNTMTEHFSGACLASCFFANVSRNGTISVYLIASGQAQEKCLEIVSGRGPEARNDLKAF